MTQKISEEQIELEVKSGYRPLAIESGISLLPFSELGDREFELLAYLLIKREIEDNLHPNMSDISLMQGVSERGRDCVLYKDGKVSGLVQCKKYKGRLSRPQSVKEILKFLLFSILDTSIFPDSKHFEYNLYVSNDFTEPAIALIYSYENEIEKEISSGKIEKYINDLIEEFESFSVFKNTPPITQIKSLLKNIKVTSNNGTDLTGRVYKYNEILSAFFNVKTVISLEGADKLIRNAFDDYGLKYLTDDDLKILHDRIGATNEASRINLGFVDFFGYSKTFFKYLKRAGFKEIMESIAEVKMLLDKKQIDFVNAEIHKLILEKITFNLLSKGKIHTFSVGIAAPYLFKRLIMRLVSGSMPEDLLNKYYPQFLQSKDELITEISQKLFDSSERVMAGDFSQLVGNSDAIDFKLKIFKHMHQGLKTIDDAKKVFKADMKLIMPVLDEIEHRINKLLSNEKTIIIKDVSFLENSKEINRIIKTIRHIEQT